MNRRASRFLSTIAFVAVTGGLLGGCVTTGNRPEDPATTGSIASQSPADTQAALEEWTQRYRAKPDDRDIALNFALVLRRAERPQQAVEVLRTAMIQNGADPVVASAYGKALAENGDFEEALRVVRNANSPRTPDWRLTSAEGAILDQVGQTAEARECYANALALAPEEPSVLNNLGLSYLLANDLPKAEAALRRAAANPRADGRVRQNLALVIGLQGRFDEAREVATRELPPALAEANIAYLRAMLSQPDTWRQIRRGDKATTAKAPAGKAG